MNRNPIRIALVLFGLVCAGQGAAQDSTDAANEPPAWYQAELERLTVGDGLWRTSNADYQSDQESYTHYAMQWLPAGSNPTWGATGRLWAETNGEATADFWTYRIYWDPESGQGMIQQFSSAGVVGAGPLVGFDQATLSDQQFTAPDGSGWRGLHHSWFEDDDQIHVTRSFQWQAGAWLPQRTYRWQRVEIPATE